MNESLHITEKLTVQLTEEQRSTKAVRQAIVASETARQLCKLALRLLGRLV